MRVRIGRVLYWAGLFMAGVLLLVGLTMIRSAKGEDLLQVAIFAAAFAGIGRGARYILANE